MGTGERSGPHGPAGSGSEGGTDGRSAPAGRPRRGPVRRLVLLYAGLVGYGVSCALQVRCALGLDPWDVLHQGVSGHVGLPIGQVSIVVGALVLLLWIPLRQRPGVGTVSNVVVIGLVMDATLRHTPPLTAMTVRVPLLGLAVALNGLSTGMYIAANYGPGPRDGLMTGLHRRTGRPVRLVRTAIEASVLVSGFLLGGSVGVGTVLYAVAIGPLSQFFLRAFGYQAPRTTASGPVARGGRRGQGCPRTPDRI